MAWKPVGRQHRTESNRRATSPALFASLVGGFFALVGTLAGTALTSYFNEKQALRAIEVQQKKELAAAETASIRRILELAAKSVAHSQYLTGAIMADRDIHRESVTPHELLIDEVVLFSPALQEDVFGFTLQMANIQLKALECSTTRWKRISAEATKSNAVTTTKRAHEECLQQLGARSGKLHVAHKRFREAIWAQAGRQVPTVGENK
jgi:hypothetical protein